jgi:WD40 repeat protein
MTAIDVVPVVIDTYECHPRLDDARNQAEIVVGLLTSHLEATARRWSGDEARTETSVKQQLITSWAGAGERNSVVLWIGHGTSDGADAWLATHETPAPITASGINPRTIADLIRLQWLRREPRPGKWAMVVIEACGAGTFVTKVAAALYDMPDRPQRLALVGLGSADGATTLGGFGRILRATLASYTDNDGDEIGAAEFISNLRVRIDDAGEVVDRGMHRAEPLHRRRLLPVSVTAPLDVYADLQTYLAALPADERRHFIPKAQGAEQGELAWYFVGRHAERTEISTWLRDRSSGLFIVTGPAGSGKSALLGNLLIYSNKTLRELLIGTGQLEPVPEWEQPPDDAFDTVVHLTGMTVHQLLTRLADAAGLPWSRLRPAERTSHALVRLLKDRGRPFTVLADALDEAQDPYAIARHVLTDVAAVPGCRVVLGTRATLHDDPDGPSGAGDLLTILMRDGRPERLVVDRDKASITTYVRRRLQAARRAGTIQTDDEAIRETAELIREKNRQFLFARLAVHELLARPQLLEPARRDELNRLLRGDHRQLFAAAVERLRESSSAAVPLLAALALAQGRGVPRSGRVWATMASALDKFGRTIDENDIDELTARAAPYIMLDAESGQSVYRMAHRTFQEHFLAGLGVADVHRRVAHALMASAARKRPINDYLIRHLPAHVARGEVWSDLAADPDLLDLIDAEAVAAEVLVSTQDLPPEINAISRSLHVLARAAPEDRRLIRSVTAGRYGARPAPSAGGFWELGWSRLLDDAPHVPINCGQGAVLAMTEVMVDRHSLLATGGSDGSVRLWNPATGHPSGDRFAAHAGAIRALLPLSSGDGRRLLASAGDDGVVRFWDPHTEHLAGEPLIGHEGPVLALAVVRRGERTLLASAGADKVVRLWDIVTRQPVEPVLSGHLGAIEELAAISSEYPYPTTLRSRDATGEIFEWQPESGAYTDAGADAEFLITASVAGSAAFVSVQTPAYRREMHVDWPHGRSTQRTDWTDKPGPITAAANLDPLGEIIAMASGENGQITIWSPQHGRQAGRSLSGHSGPIRALVCTGAHSGRRVLASTGDDGTLRLWRRLDTTSHESRAGVVTRRRRIPVFGIGDYRHIVLLAQENGKSIYADLHTGKPTVDVDDDISLRSIDVVNWRSSLRGTTEWDRPEDEEMSYADRRDVSTDFGALHGSPIEIAGGVTLDDGRFILVAALPDGAVRLWDPIDQASRRYLRGHTNAITAFTLATGGSGQPILVTGSSDQTIRHWDLETGRPAGRARGTVDTVRGLARIPGTDGDRIVSVAGNGMHLWNLDESEKPARLLRIGAHADYTGVAVIQAENGTDRVVVSTAARQLIVWNPDTEQVVRTIEIDAELHGLAGAGRDLLVDSDAGPFALRVRGQ